MKIFNNNIYLTNNEQSGDIVVDENSVQYNDQIFYITYLNDEFKKSKGGNSSVFKIYNSQETSEEYVIKISRFYKPNRKSKSYFVKQYSRFMEEISALKEFAEEHDNNIVKLLDDGVIEIESNEYPYYIMEKADTDLKEYILDNSEVDNQEKIKFCIHIYTAIHQLHKKGFYHRDIKPDNVLLFYEANDNSSVTWKIGDLGLINRRNNDYDDIGEKVGPFGWLSPEACNKFLTEKADIGFDCIIDEASDVFQLGKLFWFIFQGNIPVGQIKRNDFQSIFNYSDIIYYIIEEMLSYCKTRRIKMCELGEILEDVKLEFAI